MDVFNQAWEYAAELRRQKVPFPQATLRAARRFESDENSFDEILSALRKEGARRRGTQLKKREKPPPKPEPPKGPEQLELPFENKLRHALGIKEDK